MNDRFTFRFFNTETKKYMPAQYVDETSVFLLARLGGHKYTIEQCTGLKDKNGDLIYEGDIIKATFKYMGSNAENLCFAVAFSDGAFGYFDELGRFGLLANFGTGAMFNVVGNIHENPELLEDK